MSFSTFIYENNDIFFLGFYTLLIVGFTYKTNCIFRDFRDFIEDYKKNINNDKDNNDYHYEDDEDDEDIENEYN
jgi:Sec-independent protein translocase protein TatA